jgi:hypothetical protein
MGDREGDCLVQLCFIDADGPRILFAPLAARR